MLKNYLTVALRAMRRHPVYALMNVFGLAIALAACILIMLYINDELSYDRTFEHSDRIYRVVEERANPDGSSQHVAYTMGPVGPELEEALPEVTESVRAISRWASGRRVVRRGDVRFYVGDHLFTEQEFFSVFDLRFVAGTPSGALDEPLEVVLTEETARTYFGDEDPIGEVVSVEGAGEFTVRGVVQLPTNSHLGYSMFFSYATLLNYEGWRTWLDDWSSGGVMTYLLLAPGADASAVQTKLENLVRDRADTETSESRQPYLQALTNIHLGSAHIEFDENRSPGRTVYLYLFGTVALFVVLIASMNYMNMATARSMRRAREIGMRKVVGARRRQLVGQFLAESVLYAAVSLILAAAIVRLALPAFNRLADKSLAVDAAEHWPVLLAVLLVALIVGLVAGAYPASVLSGFRPSAVLRGTTGLKPGASPVRQGLVVAQFAMSIVLVVATLVVTKQLDFIQTKNLGFDQNHLVVVDINDGNVRSQFETVKHEFRQVPGVENVTVSNNVPGDWKNITQIDVSQVSAEDLTSAHFLGIDASFLETYEIDLRDGRSFGRDFGTDSISVLLNETAARVLGAGIGDRIHVPDDDFEATVVGLVEDFHVRPLQEPIGPVVLGYHSNPIDVIDYFTLRIAASGVPETIDRLREVGERFDPEHPFEYNFLDERLADYYAGDRRVRRIFGAAAGLAIVIACLGLFGLAAYAAERRTKEIGIRKALGATAAGIMALLTTEFAKLVGVAFLIGAPIAYVAMQIWLRDFAYRTPVGIATLLAAGALALFVAILTVSFQAFRAATTDPVKSLRYE